MLACVSRSTSLETRPPHAAVLADYDVRLESNHTLAIEARITGPFEGALTVSKEATAFVDDVRVEESGTLRPLARTADQWTLRCVAPQCRLRYRFRLHDAATALRDEQLALASDPVILSPPPTWLLHPRNAQPTARLRFRVTTEPSQQFVTGLRATAAPDVFEPEMSRFEESSFTAFGPLSIHRLGPADATIAIASGLAVEDDALVAWVRREIAALDAYLGAPRDRMVLVLLLPSKAAQTRGVTLGGGGGSSLIRLGSGVSRERLDDDWVLAHELIHTRFPTIPRKHAWFSEGLASYVEPFARVRAGLLTKEKLWRDLIDGLPQGLPTSDRGLDDDRTWGRIYWGGSLYFLLADVEIRARTRGARSLEDALRAITRTGATVASEWPLAKLIAIADDATGTRVFRELYERLALAPGSEDLEQLWLKLGVAREGSSVRFDDGAPAASLRKAMTER